MRDKLFPILIFIFSIMQLSSPVYSQTYTEANLAVWIIPITGFNMNVVNGRNFVQYVPSSSIPKDFNVNNVMDLSLNIYNDQGTKVTPLVKLAMYFSNNDPSSVGSGGNFDFNCNTLPSCNIEIDRGKDGSSYFQNSNYSSTTAIRGYLKVEYAH